MTRDFLGTEWDIERSTEGGIIHTSFFLKYRRLLSWPVHGRLFMDSCTWTVSCKKKKMTNLSPRRTTWLDPCNRRGILWALLFVAVGQHNFISDRIPPSVSTFSNVLWADFSRLLLALISGAQQRDRDRPCVPHYYIDECSELVA